MAQPPLTETIRMALAQFFADDPINRRNLEARPRDPSHQALTECFERAGLLRADVRAGKEKRVRAVLSWALDNDLNAGRRLVEILVATARGSGAFRPDSPNFAGSEALTNLRVAFESEGWILSNDGELGVGVIPEDFAGPNVTAALAAYVRRAANGRDDDAMVIGAAKDLLEATAAHVLVERYGTYQQGINFEALLGQAYVAVGLAVPSTTETANEPARKKLERGLFQAALAVNKLRNKAGLGHGRPFLPEVGALEAKLAVRTMASVAELLLDALHRPRI